MEITVTVEPHQREAWRRWLDQNHAQATEIWLIYRMRGEGGITYLDIVEEALCFGWVDGLMTPAGLRVAPDLAIEAFSIPREVRAALEADPGAWRNFQAFPPLYQRVRVSYVAEARKTPTEYERRLRNLVERTRRNEMFGNWDDAGLPRTAR